MSVERGEWSILLLLVVLPFAAVALISEADANEAPTRKVSKEAEAAPEQSTPASDVSDPTPPRHPNLCEVKLKEVIKEAGLQQHLSVPLKPSHVVLVTVPDPRATGADAVFDGVVEALIASMSERRYARDHFFLPWSLPEREDLGHCPGVLLFRNQGKGEKALAVLLIGESSAWGLDQKMFEQAIALIDRSPVCELRILGPYYSATAWSLSSQLSHYGTPRCSHTIVSGSLTSVSDTEILKTLPGSSFTSFATPSYVRRARVLEFLSHRDEELKSIALLQEAGTAYGIAHSGARKGRDPVLYVSYPLNISTLRHAYAATERSDGDKRRRRLNAEIAGAADNKSCPSDSLPFFDAGAAAINHDVALRGITTALVDRRIGDAIVTGVLSQDVVFLVEQLKRGAPDVRVILYTMDRLYTSADLASTLRGTLIATSYPMLDTDDNRRSTLSRDSAVGVQKALEQLLGPDVPQPSLTLGVISDRRLWPIAEWPSASATPPRSIGSELWVYSLLMLLLCPLRIWSSRRPHEDRTAWLNPRVPRPLALLRGLSPCTDPIVRPWHVAATHLAHCASVSILMVLATFWLCAVFVAPQDALKYPLRPSIGFLLLAFALGDAWLLVAHLSRARIAIREGTRSVWRLVGTYFRALKSNTAPESPTNPEDVERVLVEYSRAGAMLFVGPAFLCVLLTAGFTIGGLLVTAWSADAHYFIDRAVHLTSGVSPLAVVFGTLAFVGMAALMHASRLRVIDQGRADIGIDGRRYMLSRALGASETALLRERSLYAAALFPSSRRYFLVIVALSLLPFLAVAYVRPSAFTRQHDFSLEHWTLSVAMGLGLLLCSAVTVATWGHILRLHWHLTEMLNTVAVGDLLSSFGNVPQVLRRAIAAQLALGPQDPEERGVVARALAPFTLELAQESRPTWPPGVARQSEAPPLSDERGSVLLRMVDLATNGRAVLDSGAATDEAKVALRNALAAYVAFGLVRWIKQFRFLLTMATLGGVTLLISTSLYVFSVQHLLSSVFVVLTAVGVLIAAVVFVGLERNLVLSRIGGTAVGEISMQANLPRIIGWGVVPVLIAFASYYPEAVHQISKWISLIGPRFPQ